MTAHAYIFHTAAAVAFLTATPMMANGFQVFMPNLQFAEETQPVPTRAATVTLSGCESDNITAEACKAAVEQLISPQAETKK